MESLRDRPGSRAVVKLRNRRLSRQNRTHRIMMDFCPWGDVFDLLELEPYSRFNFLRRQRPNVQLPNAILLPEPFIWYAFWNLATAGILMERGMLAKDESKPSDWNVIIHRDLKPANIFLGAVSESHFRCFPEPKVGDFGLALIIPPNDDRSARRFTKAGTPATQAPEQLQRLKTARGETKSMSSKTNVFGIGITMWSLVQGREGWDSKLTNFYDPMKLQILPVIDRTALAFYSKDLLDLIDRCLKYNDDDRPTMDELMHQIRQFTGDGPVDHAQGLRDAAADDPAWDSNKITKDFTKDKFAMGTALDDLPPRPGTQESLPSPPPPGNAQDVDDLGGPEGTDFFLPPSRTARPRVKRPKAKGKANAVVEIPDVASGAANSQATSQTRKASDGPDPTSPNKRRRI